LKLNSPPVSVLTTVPMLNSVSDKHACTDAPWNRGHRCRPKTPVDASKQAHYELLNRCRGKPRPWVRIPPLPPATNPLPKRVFAFPQCAILRRRGPLPRIPADRRMGLKQSKYTADSATPQEAIIRGGSRWTAASKRSSETVWELGRVPGLSKLAYGHPDSPTDLRPESCTMAAAAPARGAIGADGALACGTGKQAQRTHERRLRRCAVPIRSPECGGWCSPGTHGTANTSPPTARRCCRAPHRSPVWRWPGRSGLRSRR
jgi:hypothetical protein